MVTSRKVGNGRAVYVGTYLTESLVGGLVDQFFPGAGVAPLVPDLPETVEVVVREAPNRTLFFIINVGDQPVEIRSLPSGIDLLTRTEVGSGLRLAGYGCAVIRQLSM
jgi:beta-galactosidase